MLRFLIEFLGNTPAERAKRALLLVVLLAVLGAMRFAPESGGPVPDGVMPGGPPEDTPGMAKEREFSSELKQLNGVFYVNDRGNDGDSFFVRHGGETFNLRLYFVDCPESYLSDRYQSQRERVADQAREMGGLSLDQAVALGERAKAFTTNALKGRPFSVYTHWEQVYGGDRYYGFVYLPDRQQFLCELLVESGLARIHTKGVDTPEGKSLAAFTAHLEELEAQARKQKKGAWGLPKMSSQSSSQ